MKKKPIVKKNIFCNVPQNVPVPRYMYRRAGTST